MDEVTQPIPEDQQQAAPTPEPDRPLDCEICKQKLSGAITAWVEQPADPKHYAHEICFWRSQAEQHKAAQEAAHKLICALLASKGGIMTVYPRDYQRAEKAKWQIEIESGPAYARYKLLGSVLEVVADLPPPGSLQ